jgi:tetratricopeptide (TPR) repeat protein
VDQKIDEIDRCFQAGDLKRAEILIARLLRTAVLPADLVSLALVRRARVRLLSERPEDALEDLESCRRSQPDLLDTPEILELLGDVYFARFELAAVGFADRGDLDRALACYDRVTRSLPEYSNLGWVRYQRGCIWLSQNRIAEAVSAFQEAVESPSSLPSLAAFCYERLGFVELFENRNAEGALDLLAKAVDVSGRAGRAVVGSAPPSPEPRAG